MATPRTRAERERTARETKVKCISHDLEGVLATKILFTMLDNYVENGTVYTNKVLRLNLRNDMPRCYLVNLYNDKKKIDRVLIRAIVDQDELDELANENEKINV